jgi:hypothetical protein
MVWVVHCQLSIGGFVQEGEIKKLPCGLHGSFVESNGLGGLEGVTHAIATTHIPPLWHPCQPGPDSWP